MQRVQCLVVLLLCSFSISAMELTTTNSSSGLEAIMDDFLTTMNCLSLNRQVRDSLRCTSKTCLKFIFSQDNLNENYKAFRKDPLQAAHWKSLGGCYYYQEFANAIKNKKYFLAQWLIDRGRVPIWDAYCSNIKEAVHVSIVAERVPVIQWLLDTRRPGVHSLEFVNYYHYAQNLIVQYPEAQKFVDIFVKYKEDEIERKAQEMVHQRMIATACSGLSIAACYGPTTSYYPNQS